MPTPYHITINGGVYSFITDNRIEYEASFIDACVYNSPDGSPLVFNFCLFPITKFDKKIPPDARMGVTVNNILQHFIQNNQNISILYLCDFSDGREFARKRHFDRWFNQYNDGSLNKIDVTLNYNTGEHITLALASIIIDSSNKYYTEITTTLTKEIKDIEESK